ncbi:MAG: hypothetical protein R2698_10330 [Microthrixaceae bacterium]
MFRSSRLAKASTEEILRSLLDRIEVFRVGDVFLAASPNGLFTVSEDEGDLLGATHRSAETAVWVRAELARLMSWVPFVDPMCVSTTGVDDHDLPAAVIPHDLVAHTLTSGPAVIDAETIDAEPDVAPRFH